MLSIHLFTELNLALLFFICYNNKIPFVFLIKLIEIDLIFLCPDVSNILKLTFFPLFNSISLC